MPRKIALGNDTQHVFIPDTCEDLSEMLAIVNAIPDGVRLVDFPGHMEGADCWCRPKLSFSADLMIVSHKDLSRGDFDS
jgi:hypothetical protein